MKRILALSALPALALVSACGGGNEVVTTNANNVILNDAQENYTFTNDEPPATDAATANGSAPANDSGMMDNVTADPATSGGNIQ